MSNYGYIGIPKSGKTSLAIAHLSAELQVRHNGAVIVDLGAVKTFRDWKPRVHSAYEAAEQAIRHRRTVVWTPEDPEETGDMALRLKRAHAGVSMLLDEVWNVWSSHRMVKGVGAWIRETQHHGGNGYYTTQRYGDLSQDALACTESLYVFRCTSTSDLDRLEKEYNLDRSQVSELPRFHSLVLQYGFQDETPKLPSM